jgi:hypothetical protein
VRPPGDLTIVLGSPAVFEGRVLGPDDGPVAGARVRVEGVLAGGARFGASATSGPDGAYSVAGLPPIERRHASPLGSLSVEARAEGFAPLLVADVLDVGPQAVPDLAEGRTTRLDLHMVRGAVVTGRVVDENGRAVGGARLALMSYERPLGFGRFADAPRHLASATTAADGTFRFACVPAAGVHRPAILGPILPFGALVALGPDDRTGVATIPVLRDGQTHTVDVALATVAWVTGRAVDEAGAPVAGAAVSARSMADRPMAAAFQGVPGMDVPCPHATTGADGRFRAAVPLGAGAGTRVGVGAEVAAAGARPYRSGERIVDLAPSGTTDAGDVVLHARPPGVHADVVVVDDAGRPVAGAAFRGRDELHMPGSAWGWPATDGGGFSRLSWRPRATDDVPGGPTPREVVVTADGFAAAVLDVAFDASAREPQRIVLETGHRIAGRVRRSDGRPAANAWVLVADAAVPIGEAVPPANSSRGSPERHPAVRGLVLLGVAHTEADGTFRVGDLPARACHVVARAEAFDGPGGRLTETARAWAADVPADTDGLELALPPASGADQPPAAPLDVRVLDDATGRPLAGATADLYDGVTTLRGTAVGEGRIRFGAVPQGIWTLRAAAPRFGDTVVRDVPVGAAAAAPVEVRVARGSAVRGRIEGVGGAALVHLVREDGAVPWFLQPCAISSGDGTFTLEGVATGRYRVVLSATSDPAVALGCADVLEVRAGDTETRFASRVVRTSSGR